MLKDWLIQSFNFISTGPNRWSGCYAGTPPSAAFSPTQYAISAGPAPRRPERRVAQCMRRLTFLGCRRRQRRKKVISDWTLIPSSPPDKVAQRGQTLVAGNRLACRIHRHPSRMKSMGHPTGNFNARQCGSFKILSIDNMTFTTSVIDVIYKTDHIAIVL